MKCEYNIVVDYIEDYLKKKINYTSFLSYFSILIM